MASIWKDLWEEFDGTATHRRWEAQKAAMKERAELKAKVFCMLYPPPSNRNNPHPYSGMGRGT